MTAPRDYLGQQLQRLRKAKGVTGRALADSIGYSQSGISKIEKGLLRPTVELVEEICKALKVTGTQKRLLLDQTRLFLEQFNQWSVRAFDSVAESQKIVQAREARATSIRGYNMQLVFGLLQTPEYMRSVFRALKQLGDEEIAHAVKNRIRRQKALLEGGKQFCLVLDERALSSNICSVDVMREQVEALASAADNPRLDLRLLPVGARTDVCPVTSFMIYDSSLVAVETLSHELVVWTESDILKYDRAFRGVHGASLSQNDSREFLRSYSLR